MSKMKIKAKLSGDIVKVKLLLKHPMLTYDQAKKKGTDPDFITHLTGKVGDRIVFDVSTSQFFSKNPLFKFKFKANGVKKGDELCMTWTDLKGEQVTECKKIK